MRAWAWLGLVLSGLWLVGLGTWLWISSVGDRDEWYALQLQRCYSSGNMKREGLQTNDAQYDQKIASISREYYGCTERVKAIFDSQMEGLRFRVRKIVAMNAGVLAAIWFLTLIAVMVGRRLVAAGFLTRRADARSEDW